MQTLKSTELPINSDGSIYHLHIHPDNVADDVLLVGDPDRVAEVSKRFDSIEIKVQNREFVTHTGSLSGKRITVMSSGIGTDNIDIVLNELDALVNIDLTNRMIKQKHRSLNIIRIGTSGGLRQDIPVDSVIATEISLGFDGLLNFYQQRDEVCILDMEKPFMDFVNWNTNFARPYFVSANSDLLSRFSKFRKGITISTPGFYAPQGRALRLQPTDLNLNKRLAEFEFQKHFITNYEMESSAIYGLSKLLGHHALTVCAIIGNRVTGEFSQDYKKTVNLLIDEVLSIITTH